jgi:hypothetical protein
VGATTPRSARLPREEREQRVLDTAAELFNARGMHEVGMDERARRTGLGKRGLYRLSRPRTGWSAPTWNGSRRTSAGR